VTIDRSTLRAVLVPYVMSRLLVIAALVVTRHIFSTLGVPQRVQASLLGWDASWYRDIAHGGYGSVAKEGLRFFPLFPMLGRGVAWLPGIDSAAGVVVVANRSALVLGFAVYALAIHERHDRRLARRAVWLVFLAPPAFVLVMGYSEATFMAAATIALLCMRKRQWWWAALAGVIAGLTRPVGILLAVPALIEAIKTRDKQAAAAVVAPVAGSLAYLAWAQHLSHNFLYPLRVQEDPTRRGETVDPIRALGHTIGQMAHGDHVSAAVHVVSALVFIGLLVVLYRRWPLSFAVYAMVALLVALSSQNLDSLERYGLAAVPFVLAGADLLADPDVERTVFVLAGAGLVLASVLAFTGVLVP
jgi:hypothetical protein